MEGKKCLRGKKNGESLRKRTSRGGKKRQSRGMAIHDLDNSPSAVFAAGHPGGGASSAAKGTGARSTSSLTCSACTSPFSASCPPIDCSRCHRKQCYNCASETVILPGTGDRVQVCDDCYFILRDQKQAAGNRSQGNEEETHWAW